LNIAEQSSYAKTSALGLPVVLRWDGIQLLGQLQSIAQEESSLFYMVEPLMMMHCNLAAKIQSLPTARYAVYQTTFLLRHR
jgi:hypothetical protein